MIFTWDPLPSTGDDGDVFLANYLEAQNDNEETMQLLEDRIELFANQLYGQGILRGSWTPTLLTAATGLTVTIAAHVSINGIVVVLATPYVKAIPAGGTVYLWEFQDNTDAVPHYGTTSTNVNPGTTANPAFLLGTVTASGSAITGITEMFRIINIIGTDVWQEDIIINAWDADADLRTGGTIYTATTTKTLDPNKKYEVFKDGVKQNEGASYDFTRAGNIFTFNDGHKPTTVSGVSEIVTVGYYVQ